MSLYLLLLVLLICIISNTYGNQLYGNYCKGCSRCTNGFIGAGILPYQLSGEHKKFILGIDYKNELSDFSYQTYNSNNKICEIVQKGISRNFYNTINITSSEIATSNYIEIPRFDHKYRCYIVHINNFQKTQYDIKRLSKNLIEHTLDEHFDIVMLNENKLKYILNEHKNLANKSPETIPNMLSKRLELLLTTYFDNNN